MNVDGPRVPRRIKPPDRGQEALPAHRFVSVFEKDGQEVEFFGREIHHFPFTRTVCLSKSTVRSPVENVWIFGLGPIKSAEEGFDPSQAVPAG
jgi:hypothetical protein